MGLLLAIETATADGSVALLADDGSVELRPLGEQRNHAKNLALTVKALVKDRFDELDGYALSIGPGSFTGLRVGLAFVKGLAVGHPRPAVGVGTLEVLARGIFDRHPEAAFALPILDARRGEVFAALYGSSGIDPRLPVGVYPVATIPDRIAGADGVVAAGDGADLVASTWSRGKAEADVPSAAVLARLARARLSSDGGSVDALLPVYLQLSAAEQNLGLRADLSPP